MLTLKQEIEATVKSLRRFAKIDRAAADPYYARTADVWALCAKWLEESLRRTAAKTQEERDAICDDISADAA